MDTIADLIGLIYDAVLDGSRWSVFLEAFVRATNGRKGTIAFAGRDEADGFALVCWHGWEDEDIRLYVKRYAEIDPWRGQGFARINEGEILTSQDVCSEEQLAASIAYREFYQHSTYIMALGAPFSVVQTNCLRFSCSGRGKTDPVGSLSYRSFAPAPPECRPAARGVSVATISTRGFYGPPGLKRFT